MYKKICKGIASVLGAVLMLSCVVTSVIPAQAATSTKGENGYETTYRLGDCTRIETYWGYEVVDESAVTLNYTSQWATAYFAIPKEVLNAGILGFRFSSSVAIEKTALSLAGDECNDKVILFAAGQSEIGIYKIGDGTNYNTQWDTGVTWTEADLPSITNIGIEYFADDVPATVTVKEVIFITKNPVGGEASADDGTSDDGASDDGASDDGAAADDGSTSSKTGESLTNLYVVCALGGLLLFAAAGTFVTEQKKRR